MPTQKSISELERLTQQGENDLLLISHLSGTSYVSRNVLASNFASSEKMNIISTNIDVLSGTIIDVSNYVNSQIGQVLTEEF